MRSDNDTPPEQPTIRSHHRPRFRQRIDRAKPSTILAVVAIVIIGIFLVTNWPQPAQKQTKPGPVEQSNTPQYQTVLPSGKTITDLGGWKKLTPPKGTPFYTYNDSIDGVPVIVSQQQLPKDLQSNTNEKVADLAKGYNATTKLNISGMTAYIGLSAKGPQSVIFTKDNLLVFVQSKKKLSSDVWQRYISSLGIPNSTDSAEY